MRILSDNLSHKTLVFDDALFSDADFAVLESASVAEEEITSLEFGALEATESQLVRILSLLGDLNGLRSVDFSFLEVGRESWKAMVSFIGTQSGLKRLNLSGLQASADCWNALFTEIDSLAFCEEIRFDSVEAEPSTFSELLCAIRRWRSLRYLSLRGLPITDALTDALSSSEEISCSLASLNLTGCGIDDTLCVDLLSKQETVLPRLKTLSLRSARLGHDVDAWTSDRGWRSTLEHLDLSLTDLDDRWVAELLSNRRHFNCLRSLDLRLTRASSAGVKDLANKRDAVPRLEKLWISSSQVDNISQEILLGGDVEPIFDAVVSGIPLNQAKVIFLGDGRAGKTSLCRRLLSPNSSTFDPTEEETDNFDIHRWLVDVDHHTAGSINVAVRLLDFGGQDILHSTHRLFLTRRAVYVLVIDGSKPLDVDRVHYWLQTIRYYGGDAPTIIAISKADVDVAESVAGSLFGLVADRRYRVVEIVQEVSAASDFDDQNVQMSLRRKIVAELSRMNSVLEKVGKKFFLLREHYESDKMGFRHEHLDQYITTADDLGISVRSEQEQYLKLLHEFATIFYWGDSTTDAAGRSKQEDRSRVANIFPAEHLLRHLIFEPTWLKATIYRLIRDVSIEENHGVITRTGVEVALRGHSGDLVAPSELASGADLILAAMHHFELLFALSAKDTYLLPGKLPASEPYTGEWLGEKRVLKFDFLPESVIHRFIVRMQDAQLVVAGTYWRTGVVVHHFDDENCRAIVSAHPDDAAIVVQSDNAERALQMELLAVIEHELRCLHASVDTFRRSSGTSAGDGTHGESASSATLRRRVHEKMLRRLYFLMEQEATVSSAEQKFEIREQIQEARERLEHFGDVSI